MCSTCIQRKADVNIPDRMNLARGSLEVVAKFCYLGDMLDACGGAQSGTITRIQGATASPNQQSHNPKNQGTAVQVMRTESDDLRQ